MTQDMIYQPDPVTCETFEEYASAMVDGEVAGAILSALELHGSTCGSCSVLLTELLKIKHDAGLLPELTPSHDLWNGIADRIGTPVVRFQPHSPPSRSLRAGTHATAWYRRPWPAAAAAAAAALLVTSSALLTYRLVATDGSADPNASVVAATAALPPAGGPANALPSASLAANQPIRSSRPDVVGAYAPEIARMKTLLDERRAVLDTGTVRILETNLLIIDRAIQESRAALERDPASGLLNRQLSDALDQKLELMRTAVRLASGT